MPGRLFTKQVVFYYTWFLLLELGVCYIDQDLHHSRRAGHHSNYEVHHHMGKMKIHTNPDGADFDFSGGDLHVDLHPAHSDVFPIYNYFHSDYHDDHHEEEEEGDHHMEPFHEMHHGSGGGRHTDSSHHRGHGYGESEHGERRMHQHHHDNHHHHMHHEHDEHEIAADHGHEHMPNLFPIGIHHPGMHGGGHHGAGHHYGHSGMVHRHDFHPGSVHHGGGGGGHHGYGKNIVPGQDKSSSSISSNLDVSRLVPSDETIGLKTKPVLDFVAESANLNLNSKNPTDDLMTKTTNAEKGFFETPSAAESVQRSSSTNMRPITAFTPDAARLIKRSHLMTRKRISSLASHKAAAHHNGRKITDFISPSAEPALADRRSFGHRPVSFKGSILGQYKKHWDDEEDEEDEKEDGKDGEEDDDDDEDDEDDREARNHHQRHGRHHKHLKQLHNVDLEDLPISSSDKKLYPGTKERNTNNEESSNSKNRNTTSPEASQKPDKAEPVKEVVDPEYKINDKLTAQEAQLQQDMQKEKDEEKELKQIHDSSKHKHNHGRHHHGNKHHHHGNNYHKKHHHHHHRHHHRRRHHDNDDDDAGDSKDETEEKIEKEEKEIEHESAKHFKEDDTEKQDADEVINSSIEDKGGSTRRHHHEDSKEGKEEENEDEKEDDDEDEDENEDNEDEEEKHEKKEEKYKFAGSDKGMDGEERRQHNFHDQLAHKTMHNFHEIEKPHEGEEKFEKDDEEEIDINDKTGEGDKDEESVERRLEEAKARLPLHFGKEGERLRHYGDVKEWGSENEKEKADDEMSKHFEQNEDKKLEGSDHDFYNDKPNFNEEAEHDKRREEERDQTPPREGNDHPEAEWHEGGEEQNHLPPPDAEWHGSEREQGVENEGRPFPEEGDFAGDRRGMKIPPGKSHTLKSDGISGSTTDTLNSGNTGTISIPVVNVKSFAQKDIYEALKKEEMGRTAKILEEQQPLGRSVMFDTLKKQMRDEPKLLVGAGDQQSQLQPQHSNANIFNQLKQKVTDEQKDAVPQQINLAGGEQTTTLADNLQKIDESTKTVGDNNNKNDILQKPDTAKMVDNKLLKDFKERFTEENGFQSVQSADEMLNDLENLALNNQKQIDAHQANGDFYKSALTTKRQEMEIASGSNKRHQIAAQSLKTGNTLIATSKDNTGNDQQNTNAAQSQTITMNTLADITKRQNAFNNQYTNTTQGLALPTTSRLAETNRQNAYYNHHNTNLLQPPPATYYYKSMQQKLGDQKKHHPNYNIKNVKKANTRMNNRHLKSRKHKLKTYSVSDGTRKETVSYFNKIPKMSQVT